MHTEFIIKEEYLDLNTDKSVTYYTEGLPIPDCSTVKQESSGVEESAVEVESEEEFEEENIVEEDPFTVQGHLKKNYTLSSIFKFNQ